MRPPGARGGRSTFLADRLTEREAITVRDVIEAAGHGDVVAVELLNRSGNLVGQMLATLVSFYNPSPVIIGGGVAAAVTCSSPPPSGRASTSDPCP